MASTKFDIEKFTSKNNFNLWGLNVFALLIQQEFELALEGETKLPTELRSTPKNAIMKKTHMMMKFLEKSLEKRLSTCFGQSLKVGTCQSLSIIVSLKK